jgi:hypothetical protein
LRVLVVGDRFLPARHDVPALANGTERFGGAPRSELKPATYCVNHAHGSLAESDALNVAPWHRDVARAGLDVYGAALSDLGWV